jgi:hypothetical protein
VLFAPKKMFYVIDTNKIKFRGEGGGEGGVRRGAEKKGEDVPA